MEGSLLVEVTSSHIMRREYLNVWNYMYLASGNAGNARISALGAYLIFDAERGGGGGGGGECLFELGRLLEGGAYSFISFYLIR